MSGTGQQCTVCGKNTPYTDWTRCEEHPETFDELLARSSIGRALRDIKERGIEAHLNDPETAP